MTESMMIAVEALINAHPVMPGIDFLSAINDEFFRVLKLLDYE